MKPEMYKWIARTLKNYIGISLKWDDCGIDMDDAVETLVSHIETLERRIEALEKQLEGDDYE